MSRTSRSGERWLAYARAAARRFAAEARHVLFDDPDERRDAAHGDAVEAAGAREMARAAGNMRGGMAKAAQLSAYLQGPGASASAEARRTLAALWDRVPADDSAAISAVVQADLGAPPDEKFATWEPDPLAAASLGEVHAATARAASAGDSNAPGIGAELAVKVQYPAVAEALRADLESPLLVRELAGSQVGFSLSKEALQTLRDGLLGELDYRAEGARMERFRAAFAATAADQDLVIPRYFPSLSSGRVLTMERLRGRTLAELARAGSDAERAAAALAIFRFTFGAPLRFGLLNADPNPGNYLILDERRVGFLDFGCGIELAPTLVDADRRLFRAILLGDGELLRHAVHEQGLLGDPTALESDTFRDWEHYFALPFLQRGPFSLTDGHVRELTRLTSHLVRTGGLALPPAAMLLWRQRLGSFAVLASLSPAADFRSALESILDGDGRHLGLPHRDK